ncbi:hypothetical protein TruAng_006052 [Truncatella angustata]|nr:hypothetical protein TruAng_006052 [Truncatella angustata]
MVIDTILAHMNADLELHIPIFNSTEEGADVNAGSYLPHLTYRAMKFGFFHNALYLFRQWEQFNPPGQPLPESELREVARRALEENHLDPVRAIHPTHTSDLIRADCIMANTLQTKVHIGG